MPTIKYSKWKGRLGQVFLNTGSRHNFDRRDLFDWNGSQN